EEKRKYLLNLASLDISHDQYLDAINLLEKNFGRINDPVLLEFFYPIPYSVELRSFAARENLNPLLIAAVLRTLNYYSKDVFQSGAKNSLYKLSAAIRKYQNVYLGLTSYLTDGKYQLTNEIKEIANNDPDLFVEMLIDGVKFDLKEILNNYLIYKKIYSR
ncbi:MAG: hypothetical protein WC860_07965, partial [Candidatus Margulisiibacteriota bacterium]